MKEKLLISKYFCYFSLIEREVFFVTLSNGNQDVTMVVFVALKSIQCKHFDEATDVWDTTGCSVVNSTTNTTMCRCDRIAQFGVSEMPISTELSFHNVPVCCYLLFWYCFARRHTGSVCVCRLCLDCVNP